MLGGAEAWQDHDLISPGLNGEPLMFWRIDGHWPALRDSCDVSPVRFHNPGLRCAFLAITSGMDVRMLAERLVHADITLKVCGQVLTRRCRRVASGLGSLLTTAGEISTSPATRTTLDSS
ncbi:hypothetical protein LAJ19_06475 [Deinococcus taeanensis]|uniref:hypothetical protein n=1 Tax=Deinococcus taeanensis TaxID=2737050 RepID=UPI001CDB8AE5|nr:hypothetical protein [Deinococcus taeanensis]UBV43855.1 hypothetical protein LAJ19_06475 [Deinococcus taeanensis]